MNFPDSFKITCGNCLSESEYFDWVSSHSLGAHDLDTRPSEDSRTAMKSMFVKMCPNCKYCYRDIGNISEIGRVTIRSNEYLSQIDNLDYPVSANQFFCKSIILEAEGNIINAAWAMLHAAWCCDDTENYIQSKLCRIKAIELFQIANSVGLKICENDGEFVCVLVDLYRKSENFGIARKLAEQRFKTEKNDLCRKILFFQLSLIENRDLSTYTTSSAISFFAKNYPKLSPDN